MLEFSFSKYHGSGNDFIVIEDLEDKLEFEQSFIKKLCERKFGIGADGILFLKPSSSADFKMLIFNADGSEASFCGNGLLVLLNHIRTLKVAKDVFSIETLAKIVRGGFLEKRVYFETSLPQLLDKREVDKKSYFLVDSGVPHIVTFVKDLKKVDVETEGRRLRTLYGANVNFAKRDGEKVEVRTFERGVEAETLSCGSGALAVASLCNIPEVTINFRSGFFKALFADSSVKLVGESHFVYYGKYRN